MDAPRLTSDEVSRLRESLVAADFTVDGVLAALGPTAYSALGREETVPGLRSTTEGSPLETLIRLFLLQAPVDERAASAALPLDACVGGGLLSSSGSSIRALVDVRPYASDDDDFYVVSDLGGGLGGARRTLLPDHVLGIGGASTTLAGLTVRLPLGSALDLGTGCGVQALHLAGHVDAVTGSDRNPRALALAALTTAMSEVEVELVEGSLFEPVAGRRFDLVVSNPPFVVSPVSGSPRFTYRDSGLPGDDLCRRLVGQAPAHLTEGGWCQLLASWLHVEGEDWRERVAAWVAPTGCDAWVVEREVQDPTQYAELWLRDSGDHLSPEYTELYDAWLASFEQDRTTAVGFGWIVLHAAGHQQPRLRLEEVRHPVEQPLGPAVVDWFARHDWLRRTDSAALLGARLAVDEAVVLRRDARVAPAAGWLATDVGVQQTSGLRRSGAIDEIGAAVLGGCDGHRTLTEVLAAVATAYDLDEDELCSSAPEAVRGLVEEGFLRPVDRASDQASV